MALEKAAYIPSWIQNGLEISPNSKSAKLTLQKFVALSAGKSPSDDEPRGRRSTLSGLAWESAKSLISILT